jgi:hypothetical protein
MFSAILIISMLTILRWAWLSEAKQSKTNKNHKNGNNQNHSVSNQ